MLTLLERLDRTLRTAEPELFGQLLAPAGPAVLNRAQAVVGHDFPESLRRLYGWHDGQQGKGTFPLGPELGRGLFLPVERALARRELLLDRDRWEAGWWPLVDRGDGDCLVFVLDGASGASDAPTAPTSTTAGHEVFFFRHESPRCEPLFGSLEAWLRVIVSQLEDSQRRDPLSSAALAAHLGQHPATAADWNQLRAWSRSLEAIADPPLFARLVLALEPPSATPEHPVLADMRSALETFLATPGTDRASARAALHRAVGIRARTFVPRPQLRPMLQHASEAALADSASRAGEHLLHALAHAEPDVVAGSLAPEELGARCRALQQRLQEILS